MEWDSYICVWFAIYKFVYHSFTEYSVTWNDSVYSIESVTWNEVHTYVCDSLYTHLCAIHLLSIAWHGRTLYIDLWITHLLYMVWHGMSHSMSHYRHVTLYKWGVHEPHSKTLIPCHYKESPDTKPISDLLYLSNARTSHICMCVHVTLYTDLWMSHLLPETLMYIWNIYIQVSFHICRSLFIYVGLFSYM